MKEKLKQKKGITLIALVVTIVVLIILAGVSINLVLGENGIIQKAQYAKRKTEITGIIERAQTDLLGEQIKTTDGQVTKPMLKAVLDTYFSDVPEADLIELNTELTSKEGNYKIQVSEIYNGEFGTAQKPSDKPAIPTTESYVGYYADIDGDKTIDGIIYADLAVGGSGTWNSDSWSSYEYTKVTEGLKSYYISSENGTGFGTWKKPVITAKEGTTGKDRFYVMALEDFNPGTSYYWYNSAYDKLNNLVGNTTNDFGQGKTNTTTMIAEWNKGENGKYGAQNTQDMWGVIQKADSAGKTWDLSKWFVPSKAEWAAFGDITYTKIGLTTGNYDNYGLKTEYWSSAQSKTNSAYFASFFRGQIGSSYVIHDYPVRLSATF